ncbi:uncharacterized protein BJ171DRAFT_517588 [Polychytrium aggregatum]|uniref:uncharacterized protein n=1 Tax=Polychytrium aggregatum TaxID=110093 RepID=UPI0022FF4373|nr:uncharacterized protein BJ171DRAFT_517588 [Polychytrium aggregatum]KAI9199709.1 hypothetical protein BJ171DRAFT_517588 [Polychytrium aggregatum]
MDDSAGIIYNKQVPITVKSSSTQPAPLGSPSSLSTGASSASGALQERRHSGITVQIRMAHKQGGRLKVLQFRITDEADPYFLYQLDIAEDDFHILKTEQNLLVDFQQFPEKVTELLDLCILCRSDDHPKYLAFLTTSSPRTTTFSIIETNTFKHISHIALAFIPGNDVAIKEYLAGLVVDFKAENAMLKSELDTTGTSLSTRLRDLETSLARKSTEIESLKLIHANQISDLSLRHSEEMAKEREQAYKEKEEVRRQLEQQKRDADALHIDELNALTLKYNTLTATHSHLLSHNKTLEQNLGNLTRESDAANRRLNETQIELEKTRQICESQDLRNQELEQQCEMLRSQLSNSERRERERDEAARRLESLLESSKGQLEKRDAALDIYKVQNDRLQENFGKATEEINKGNEIIRRLQGDLKTAKNKIKLKNAVTVQQEQLLDERLASLEKLQREHTELKGRCEQQTRSLAELQKKLEEREAKIEQDRQTIEDNNHVIEWLHKQLNEEALGRPLGSQLLPRTGTDAGFGQIDFDRFASSLTPGPSKGLSEAVGVANYRSKYAPAATGTLSGVAASSTLGQRFSHPSVAASTKAGGISEETTGEPANKPYTSLKYTSSLPLRRPVPGVPTEADPGSLRFGAGGGLIGSRKPSYRTGAENSSA